MGNEALIPAHGARQGHESPGRPGSGSGGGGLLPALHDESNASWGRQGQSSRVPARWPLEVLAVTSIAAGTGECRARRAGCLSHQRCQNQRFLGVLPPF